MAISATALALDAAIAYINIGMKFTNMVNEAAAEGREISMEDFENLKAKGAAIEAAWEDAGK